jgi:hypothetical protein
MNIFAFFLLFRRSSLIAVILQTVHPVLIATSHIVLTTHSKQSAIEKSGFASAAQSILKQRDGMMLRKFIAGLIRLRQRTVTRLGIPKNALSSRPLKAEIQKGDWAEVSMI